MKKSISRIGIMGGTFDPVHLAHIEMARCAKEQKQLDEIWFMPSKIPPHKRDRMILSEDLRGQMVKLAVEGERGFYYSDFELKRDEVTYTAKTLELLTEQYPESQFYFILGGDSLFQFANWYMPERILQYAVLLAVSRNGVSRREMEVKAQELSEQFHGSVEVLSMREMNISSSMIREKICKGESVKEYLPAKVYDFIKARHLYADVGNGI